MPHYYVTVYREHRRSVYVEAATEEEAEEAGVELAMTDDPGVVVEDEELEVESVVKQRPGKSPYWTGGAQGGWTSASERPHVDGESLLTNEGSA